MTRSALVRELSIAPGEKLIKAIEQITQTQHKILMVLDADGCLLGVLTDYDIRQAILTRSSLDTSIGDVIGHNPVVAHADASDSEIVALIQSTRCHPDSGSRCQRPADRYSFQGRIRAVARTRERNASRSSWLGDWERGCGR